MLLRFLIATCAALPLTASSAELRMAPSLTSNMVLQQAQSIRVWGEAQPRRTIRVTLGSESATTVAQADGHWHLELKPREASFTALKLTVTDAVHTIELTNILIGEVWLCAGQSNMAMPVAEANAEREAAAWSKNDGIRFLTLARRPFTKLPEGDVFDRLRPTAENKAQFIEVGQWQMCQSSTVGQMSAVAYWFARELCQRLDVPIGCIVPAVGGSSVQAWVSRETIAAQPETEKLLARWMNDEPAKLQRGELARWLKSRQQWTFDESPLHRCRPGCLFELALQPLRDHRLRGVIWYQGEQNAETRTQLDWHGKLFPALLQDVRDSWRSPRLPFYYVQLPAYDGPLWPEFREQQRRFGSLPHVGMAVTIDCGDATNNHPPDKRPIGERLARLALARTYKHDVVAGGPIAQRVEKKSNRLSIVFASDAVGLHTRDGRAPVGFEAADAAGVFRAVPASIAGERIVIEPAGSLTQVRYGWKGFPRPKLNLVNAADLPASPFHFNVD
jgi:sialate O-acetylesterase